MANKFKIEFHLKLHPSLYWPQFHFQYLEVARRNNWLIIDKEVTLNKVWEENKYGWAIGVNTTAYYESYIQYVPCLRYNDGTFGNWVDIMDDVFCNENELRERYFAIPFNDTVALKRYFLEADKELDYAIGINKNKYHSLNV